MSGTDTTLEAVQLNLAYARLIGVRSLLDCNLDSQHGACQAMMRMGQSACSTVQHICVLLTTLLSPPIAAGRAGTVARCGGG